MKTEPSHFNAAAKTWETPETLLRNQRFAEHVQALLDPSRRYEILDLGCGTGALGAHFVDKATRLVGVDPSAGMLEVFTQKFQGLPQVTSVCADLEHDAPELGRFDLILSAMAFHHLQHPAQMLKRLAGMLNPNGLICVFDLDQEDGSFHPDNKAMGVHHFGFSREERESWRAEAGLALVSHSVAFQMHKNQRTYDVLLSVYR